MFLLLWGDDILLFAPVHSEKLQSVRDELCCKYKMVDLVVARAFIGIDIERDRVHGSIKLHQHRYTESILKEFGLSDTKGHDTTLEVKVKLVTGDSVLDASEQSRYQSIVSKLMYAMVATRPYLVLAVSTLGKICSQPNKSHLAAAK